MALLRSLQGDSSSNLESWVRLGIAFVVALAVGVVLHALLFRLLRRLARNTSWDIDDLLTRVLGKPALVVVLLLALQVATNFSPGLDLGTSEVMAHVFSLGTIVAVTCLALSAVSHVRDHLKGRFRVDVADNLEARRVHTQIDVLARSLWLIALMIGIAAALMTFPRVRQLGSGLFASAGIAGLALGLAARPVLENLIAGVQIAISQPIRLDDVVVIDGEWGRIEEITGTYVVLRVWDQRRLIIPFSKILANSFENWTRTSAEILGTVFLHADYRVPVERVRAEVKRIAEASELWDGRVCGLVVSDAKAEVIELRALVSSADSGKNWDLRVHLREKLIEFLQRELPECLPRTRVEVEERASAGA
jgi:small-conductance mechanosensitive channel